MLGEREKKKEGGKEKKATRGGGVILVQALSPTDNSEADIKVYIYLVAGEVAQGVELWSFLPEVLGLIPSTTCTRVVLWIIFLPFSLLHGKHFLICNKENKTLKI